MSIDTGGKSSCFCVRSRDGSVLQLRTETADDKEAWMEIINRAIAIIPRYTYAGVERMITKSNDERYKATGKVLWK